MFTLQNLDAKTYRSKTRTSSLILILVFAALGMGLSSLFVLIWGTPGGNNFLLNLFGVLTGAAATLLLVRFYLKDQPFMRQAVYGWQLKRNLMRITNIMHRVRPLAASGQVQALQLLHFYHLALEQMHRLEGNDTGLLELKAEKLETEQKLQALGVNSDQQHLDPAWLQALQGREVS